MIGNVNWPHLHVGAPQGWQCPVCKRVMAPFMPNCTGCPSQYRTVVTCASGGTLTMGKVDDTDGAI